MPTKVLPIYPMEALPPYGPRRLCTWFEGGTPDSNIPEPFPFVAPLRRHLQEGYDFDTVEAALEFRRRTLKVFSDGTNLGDNLPFRVVIEGPCGDVPREVNGVMASRESYI